MTKLILELCQNHNGSLKILEEMIHAASEQGARYLKIQDINSSELVQRKKFDSGIKRNGKIVTIKRPYFNELERLKNLDMSEEFIDFFIKKCKQYSCHPIVTPFTYNSYARLKSKKLKFIKIASYDCSAPNFLIKIKKLKKPMIVSTGATTKNEIISAKRTLGKSLHSLLHCVTIYPTPLDKCNLSKIQMLKKFTKYVGWSDHTHFANTGHTASFCASMLGADYIERHFTIIDKNKSKDGPVSINPKEAKQLLNFFKITKKDKLKKLNKEYKNWEICLGNGSFKLSHEERLNRDYYRGRFAKKIGKKIIFNWKKDFE